MNEKSKINEELLAIWIKPELDVLSISNGTLGSPGDEDPDDNEWEQHS
jgi:hypothetical protein